MIDFKGFLPDDKSPIYLQILQFIKRGAAAGIIRNGDELPSRRSLSALLGINPNTVQKAFALLEAEGLVCSRSGAKSVMVLTPERMGALRRELTAASVAALTADMRQMGVSKEEVLQLIADYWKEGEDA